MPHVFQLFAIEPSRPGIEGLASVWSQETLEFPGGETLARHIQAQQRTHCDAFQVVRLNAQGIPEAWEVWQACFIAGVQHRPRRAGHFPLTPNRWMWRAQAGPLKAH